MSEQAPQHQETQREIYDEDGNRYLVSEIEGWWEVAIANPDAPEGYTKVRLNRHTTKTRPLSDEEQFEPATPARITPSRS